MITTVNMMMVMMKMEKAVGSKATLKTHCEAVMITVMKTRSGSVVLWSEAVGQQNLFTLTLFSRRCVYFGHCLSPAW